MRDIILAIAEAGQKEFSAAWSDLYKKLPKIARLHDLSKEITYALNYTFNWQQQYQQQRVDAYAKLVEK
jgi:hypothetical protein